MGDTVNDSSGASSEPVEEDEECVARDQTDEIATRSFMYTDRSSKNYQHASSRKNMGMGLYPDSMTFKGAISWEVNYPTHRL